MLARQRASGNKREVRPTVLRMTSGCMERNNGIDLRRAQGDAESLKIAALVSYIQQRV